MEFNKLLDDPDKLANIIEKADNMWRGAFSMVYYLADLHMCVKETDDVAYIKFVHLAMKYKHKNFPEIYGTNCINGTYYIFMERLYHSELTHTHADGAEMQGYHEYDTGLWKGFNDELDSALLILDYTLESDHSLTIDLRPSNIMERLDGTLVITDPFYDKENI